ncbi:proliferation marker protein Ki-67-like isoform X2 [Polyodon spathula]|uniref:proliferation marker protein Ki-67-like isoform X2 n=1 Tax=Polyodon spathula TaxID=7913 RepID=UPI001B7DA9AE|nr:proliferation marker protein Ki-67-like isoform X2 [Polyodon spathula]
MPLHGKIVVIKRSGADGTEFPLTAQSCLFGRKPDCDIRIQLPHVSKEHCKIEVNENKEVIVTNLSAVNPTRLNGKIVHQSESLKDRDVITIIDRSFRFEYPPELTQRKRRQSASVKNETLQQVKDTVCLSPGNRRKSTTSTSDASYDQKEAKAIGTELLSEAHIKNATPGTKDASDAAFAHNHRGNQEKLLEGLSPFSQLYKTLKRQFQANDYHQVSSKDGKTPRKASGDAAPQSPLSRCTSDKISPTQAVGIQINEDKSKVNHELPLEVKSTPLPQVHVFRQSFVVCEKSVEEAMSQNLVSCVSSEDELNKEIIDLSRSRRSSKVIDNLQSGPINGETSQKSNRADIIVTPKNDRRSASRGDGFVEPSVSDNEASCVDGTPKSKRKGRPRKSPLKDNHAGGNSSICESVKENPAVVENVIGTDKETPKRRRRSSQPTPVKSAEKEKESGGDAQHKQDSFSNAKETQKSKRNSRQFTLQRSVSADEVLKELPSSAKKLTEEMALGGKKIETPKKGRKSIESETPASEAELTPKKVSSSLRRQSRSLSPACLETQDPVKINVNGIITPQEEKKVATPKKTQESPVTSEVLPKQKTPNSSPRRHSGTAVLKAEVLPEIESLAPPSGENDVETGTKKTSSKKRRSGELHEKLAGPPLKRKRVSFAGHLSPELFDKRLPPDSPLRKGAMPTRLSLSVGSKGRSVLRRASTTGIKYSLIKEFSEDNLSPLKPSPKKKASPKKTPCKPNTLSPDKKSPKLIAKTPSSAMSVAKTSSPGRKSLTGTGKTPTMTSLTASSDKKSPNVADVELSPGWKSPTSAAKTTSPGVKLLASASKMPSPASTITNTPSPGRKSLAGATKTPSPARSVTKTPSPARSVTKTPSPARSVTKTPSPARSVTKTPSPARSVTKTPSPARSVTKTPSPARSVTKAPSSNRKSLPSITKTPSPAMSLAKTPSPGRKLLTDAAKTPSSSGAAKMPPPSRWSLAGAAEIPSPNKSVTKSPSAGRKSLGTSANTTPVVSTTTPKRGTPYVSGRFSISHISTPSPIPEQSTVASKAEPVPGEIHCDAVTPKPSLRRKSIQSTGKKTSSRRKSSVLDAVRSRSGASKANLLVARSWADIVKLGAAKTQRVVFAKKQATKAKKVTIKKVTSKILKTPAQKIKDHISTGHADSPATIVIGRAHVRAVEPAGQVPKLVRNVALMKRSMEVNESFTGIAEMFSTPVNEKPGRTPRHSSASTEVVCSTPVSLTDASVLNTPEETGEMVVSPLSSPSTARRGRYNKDAVTRLLQEKESSYSVIKTPAKEIIAPVSLSGGSQVRVQPSEEVVDTSEQIQTLVKKTATETDDGCKKIMRTPKQKAEPLVALTGVKRLMKTPKQKSKQIEDFRGLQRLMRTPKKPKEQIIEDLVGVKRIMTTPKQKASPVEDMVGIKRLMRTPKHKGETVEDMSSITRIVKSPKLKIAPVEDFAGLQELMEEPEEKKQDHESKVIAETFEASETKSVSKKHELVRTPAILAQSSVAAQQPPSKRSCREDCEISVLPTPLNNCGRTEQVKLTMDIAEHSAVQSSTDTLIGSVKTSLAQTASIRKSGRGRKTSDVELSSLETISVEVCPVKSDNISKPTTVCVKLSPTPKRATHGTENKDTSRSDTLTPPAFEIALVKESSIDSVKLSTPSRRSQHGNEKDTVHNESSILSPPANKTQRGNKQLQNVEQNHASTELTDLTVDIVKAFPVSAKWTHGGQIKEVETSALPPETNKKIEEVDHMLNKVAAEETFSQSVSSPIAKRSHGAIEDVAELDTTDSPAPMKKSLRCRKAQYHSDDIQETSTEVVAAESVMSLPVPKRSQQGAVKDVAEEAIASSPGPTKKSGRGRKAKQNSEDKHETATKVVAEESCLESVMPTLKRSRRGAVKDIVKEEITASPAPAKKSGRGRKAKPNSDETQETTAEAVVAEESSLESVMPFSTAKRSEQGAVKDNAELETTASPATIKKSGRVRKAKPNSSDPQETSIKEVSAKESLPERVMCSPQSKGLKQGAFKDTTELENTASPAPTKKSGRGRKAKPNSDDPQETSIKEVSAKESLPEREMCSPKSKRLKQGAFKDTTELENTASPAPTKKSGRGRKAKPNSDDPQETSIKEVSAKESLPEREMCSPKSKRLKQGAFKDTTELENTASPAPTKKSGRGRKAKPNSDDPQETSIKEVSAKESLPEREMCSPKSKRLKQGAFKDTTELENTASPAPTKKSGRGRKAKPNSDDPQETSIKEVSAKESLPEREMCSPKSKRLKQGAFKDTTELENTASPAPTKKSGRGRKAKPNSDDPQETSIKEVSAKESLPEREMCSPKSKRLKQGAFKDTTELENTASPAPTKKSGRGRKAKVNLDGTHETPVEAVAAESVMSSPSMKRSRRGANRDTAEVETTITSAPTKTSGKGRKAKLNTEDPYETSLVVAVEKSCPESLMLPPTTKRSRQGVVSHTAEVTTTASPAVTKKSGRGRKTKQNSDTTHVSSAEVSAAESEMPSPTTKGARRGAIKDIAEKETTASLGMIKKSGRSRTAKQNSNDTQETSIEVTAAEKSCPESVMPSPTLKRSQRSTIKDNAEAETVSAHPIKKSGRGRKVKHVEEIENTSTEVPEESRVESSIKDTAMLKTRRGKKVAPVRETRGTTKKNGKRETEDLETSKISMIMDEIKNLSKKKVKWSTGLTMENDTPENNAVEHVPATEKRSQRGKARSEKGETLDIVKVPVQPAKLCRGRPGRKPKMTEAEMVQEQIADETSSKEESKQAVGVSSKREASLEVISNNVTAIEKEGLCGKTGSKRKMICNEQENVLIEVAPKRGRRGKAKTTVDEEAQSSTGPSDSTVEIKAVPVVETVNPRSIKRTGRAKASSQQKLNLPKETNDQVIDESASQAEKPVELKKPIGRGKRKLELDAETEADVSFLSPLKSTRGNRANLTNEAESRMFKTAADGNVTRGKVSRRGAAAASDKRTAATKTEGKPVRSTRRR